MCFTLAFIPARGGSKGILKKNLAILNNRPLISYTVELSKKINVDDIFISSDDEEILEYCAINGFSSKYRRPSFLSEDDSSMVDTLIHGVQWYESAYNRKVENVILLQPTNPLRKKDDINTALKLFINKKLDSLVSVSKMIEHPFECIEIENDLNWKYLRNPDVNVSRRQDYSGNYGFIDGSFYISKWKFIEEYKKFIVPCKTYPFITSQKYSIDIDEPEDLKLVEALMKI